MHANAITIMKNICCLFALSLALRAADAPKVDVRVEKLKVQAAQIAVLQAQLAKWQKIALAVQATYQSEIGGEENKAQANLNTIGIAACKATNGELDLAGITCPAETKTAPDAKKN
jgi:hypothetical protein